MFLYGLCRVNDFHGNLDQMREEEGLAPIYHPTNTTRPVGQHLTLKQILEVGWQLQKMRSSNATLIGTYKLRTINNSELN